MVKVNRIQASDYQKGDENFLGQWNWTAYVGSYYGKVGSSRRGKTSCENNGITVTDHFADVSKMSKGTKVIYKSGMET